MARLFAILASLILVLLGSCANSEPQVSQVFHQVNRHWDPEGSRWNETLSVYVQVSNADGIEALVRLHILCDAAHLHWTLTPSTWTRVDRTGETWIGASALSTPEGSLPTGAWRIQIATAAGTVTEQPFALAPEAPGTPPPRNGTVTLKRPEDPKGPLQLSGFASDFVIWAYADTGELLGQKTSTDPQFQVSTVVPGPGMAERVRSLVFYSFDKSRGEGLKAGPFTLK